MASASTTPVDGTANQSPSLLRENTAPGGSGSGSGGEYSSNNNNENKGFSSLPVELISEIISHLPAFSVPTHETTDNPKALYDEIAERRYTLYFLSQTGRFLRGALRRYVWERIEVFDGMRMLGGGYLPAKWEGEFEGTPRSKLFAEEVMRQLEYVTVQDPSLAKYVKVANIIITKYSPERVLKMVAESFALFPNLHTVQLIQEELPKCFEAIFANYQYPQIRRLSLRSNALFLMNSCPQLQGVYPYLGVPLYFSGLPVDQDRCFPTIEALGITTLSRLTDFSYLNNMKNLHDISLHVPNIFILTNCLKKLLLLRQLHTIRLRMDKRDTSSITSRRQPQISSAAKAAETEKNEVEERKKIESCIHPARDEVHAMQRTSDSTNSGSGRVEKKIIVTYRGGRKQTFVV